MNIGWNVLQWMLILMSHCCLSWNLLHFFTETLKSNLPDLPCSTEHWKYESSEQRIPEQCFTSKTHSTSQRAAPYRSLPDTDCGKRTDSSLSWAWGTRHTYFVTAKSQMGRNHTAGGWRLEADAKKERKKRQFMQTKMEKMNQNRLLFICMVFGAVIFSS